MGGGKLQGNQGKSTGKKLERWEGGRTGNIRLEGKGENEDVKGCDAYILRRKVRDEKWKAGHCKL